ATTLRRRFCHAPAFLLLLFLCLVGCITAPGTDTVREIHLFGVPVAVNLNQEPGPDGFAVRVYASNGRAASGLRIKTGRLEVALYDGGKLKIGPDDPPLRVWTYDPNGLKPFAAKSFIGWGYRFALPWAEARPTHDRFTIVVRYVAPSGEIVASSPS